MDIRKLLDNPTEEVSCSMCWEIYKEPKQLPCLHSFCLACLNNLARERAVKGNIQCPLCQRQVAVPDSGTFESLPSTLYISSLLDVLAIKQCSTAGVSCRNYAKKSQDSSYCFDCSRFWCGECLNAHNILQENKEHRVVALKDFQAKDYEDVFKRPAICKKKHHQKVLEYYCKKCEVVTCQVCTTLEHGGHKIKNFEAVSEKEKDKIVAQLEKANIKVQEYAEQIQGNEKKSLDVQQRMAVVRRELDDFTDEMVRIIRRQHQELITEAEKIAEDERNGLAKRNEELKVQSDRIQAEINKVKNLVLRGTSAEIVTSRKQVEEQLQLLLTAEPRQQRRPENGRPAFAQNVRFVSSLTVDGIGRVWESFTGTHHSTAEGEGLTKAVTGLEAEFVVTTRKRKGDVRYSSMDRVAVEIKRRRGGEEHPLENVQVEDNKDGTYRVSYFAAEPGDHDVRVTVNGEDVRGSPFPPIHVKPREFTAVTSFGTYGNAPGQFYRPWGVAVNEHGEMAVSDCYNHRVQVFSSEGKFLFSFGEKGSGQGQFERPRGVTYEKRGNLLVADCGNHRILQFSRTGEFIKNFGTIEDSSVMLRAPHGLSSDPNGNILVSDFCNKRVVVFSPEGRVLLTLKDKVLNPVHCIRHENRFIVSYGYNGNCIKVYSKHGDFLHQFGTKDAGNGQFNGCMGLAIDKSGRLVVCDSKTHRIQLFKLDGTFCSTFGVKGTGLGQFKNPGSVSVLKDGKFTITGWNNYRVQIIQ